MRVSWAALAAVVWLVGMQDGVAASAKAVATKQATCRVVALEGAVRAGESFVRPIGEGLEVMLEPLASGWILRVLPVAGPRGQHDYAELATPPYRSVSPLLVSTDFSFRAQDAVAWNPRRFRFAASRGQFEALLAAYESYLKPGVAGQVQAEAEARLAGLAASSPAGELEILDARFVPGLANQAKMAAAVASHLETTPHTVEQAADEHASQAERLLGRVTWLRFRLRLELPAGFRPAPGASLKPSNCSSD